MKKIYDEKAIILKTTYDWREDWVSTAAEINGELIAEFIRDEGPVLYVDGVRVNDPHDDHQEDDFIGVKTAEGIIPLSDWIMAHEQTASVEAGFCHDVAAAYAAYVMDGRKNLFWNSPRGFANEGTYWLDQDFDINDSFVDADDPDKTWDLSNPEEYKEAKEQLVEWYAEILNQRRNPAEYHEQHNVRIPPDEEFVKYTF